MKNRDNLIIIIAIAVLGFFSGIAFVNNWLVLNKNYPHISMFDIPFMSDVWGTVSDWTMVIVTTVTAIYLVKTFMEQKRANSISYKNYLETIKPFFTIGREENEYGDGEKQAIITLTLREHPAYEITPNILKGDYIESPYEFKWPILLYPNGSFIMIIRKEFPLYYFVPQQGLEIMSITYKDKEGVEYKQVVLLGQGNRWNITGPERLKETI